MIIGGVLLLAGSQLVNYYTDLHDFVQGIMLGCGVGILISGLMNTRKTREQ